MRTLSILAGLASITCLLSNTTAWADPLNTGVTASGSLITPGSVDTAWTGYDATAGAAVTAYAVSGYQNQWISQPNAGFLSPAQSGGHGKAGGAVPAPPDPPPSLRRE